MTASCFIELRKATTRGTDSSVADVMRHLHTRQHLGKAVIITDQPAGIVGSARKQWLKLSRTLQRQRSSTINADKILKYTHGITRMQRMRFSGKTPLEEPEADVYFLHPNQLSIMPVHCWSMYLLCPLDPKTALNALYQLPQQALVVDYMQSPQWQELGLKPKKTLEAQVTGQWRQVTQFLKGHDIDVGTLIVDGIHDVEAMDDALDTLLGGHAHQFMQVASEFQRSLELARPLRLSKKQRSAYDSLILLAHRVQALTPGAFAHQFLEVYDEDDTFFFYDPARKHQTAATETLAQAFARHTALGHHNLAQSLRSLAEATAI